MGQIRILATISVISNILCSWKFPRKMRKEEGMRVVEKEFCFISSYYVLGSEPCWCCSYLLSLHSHCNCDTIISLFQVRKLRFGNVQKLATLVRVRVRLQTQICHDPSSIPFHCSPNFQNTGAIPSSNLPWHIELQGNVTEELEWDQNHASDMVAGKTHPRRYYLAENKMMRRTQQFKILRHEVEETASWSPYGSEAFCLLEEHTEVQHTAELKEGQIWLGYNEQEQGIQWCEIL